MNSSEQKGDGCDGPVSVHPGLVSESVSCSVMSDSLQPHAVALRAPLSLKFSSQEYWSGEPISSPGDLPYPGIEPGSTTLQADLFYFIV